MLWSIIQVVSKQGVTLIIFAVLALFLSPKDFGILGMAMVWIAFIQIFSEMGFSAALIQRQDVNSKHLSTIYFINIASGMVLTIFGILLSWPCAWFFKTPAVQPIMAILSFGLIISSSSLTHMVILQKKLRFRCLAIIDFFAALIGGLVGVIMAYMKFGVWSLVAQSLTSYFICSIILLNISEWKPKYKEFTLECVNDLWPYSSKIFAFQLFKFSTQNIDKIIIGYFLGSVALGLYTFAYKFVIYPISVFSGAIGNYLFPKFSSMQNDLASVKADYLFIVKATNSIVIPGMVTIILLSPTLIPMLFGEKWNEAILLIPILSILAIITPWISYSGQGTKALNRPGWLFIWSIFITVLTSGFMCIGMYYNGIYGVTLGRTIAYITAMPINFIIVKNLLNISFAETINTFIPSFLSGSLVGLIFLIFNIFIFHGYTSIYIKLIFIVSIYIFLMTIFDRLFICDIFKKLIKHEILIK